VLLLTISLSIIFSAFHFDQPLSFKVDIDFDNKAFFVIFTVLGYPPGMDEELNELPDAIRPLPEVRKIAAVLLDHVVVHPFCLQ
jgi:hypothetical protein